MGYRLTNAIWSLILPFVCLFTIPLALVASLTTAFAFAVLVIRVASVYIDVALHIVPHYLQNRSRRPLIRPSDVEKRRHYYDGLRTPSSPTASFASGYSTPSPGLAFPPAPGYTNPGWVSPRYPRSNYFVVGPRRSHQGSSQASLGSAASAGPLHEGETVNGHPSPLPANADAYLTPSVGLDRDFEGVGGWRFCDDDEESAEWTRINSRLDLWFGPRTTSYPRHHRPHASAPSAPGEAPSCLVTGGSERRRKASVSPNASRVTFGPTIQVSGPPASPGKEASCEPVSPKTIKRGARAI